MSAQSLRRAAERCEQASRLTVMSRITPAGAGLMAQMFRHAAALAAESEVEAGRASDSAMTYVEPKYDPLVALLIEMSKMSDDRADAHLNRAKIIVGGGEQS